MTIQLPDITLANPTTPPAPPPDKTAPGTQQFGRQFSLIVGNNAGEGLELGEFRCVFHVQRGDYQNPNTCDVRVYNLSRETANSMTGKFSEFTQLALQAGYPGNFGLLFRGVICQARIGRESPTDTYVDFTAADGDEAYNYATVCGSQAAGPNTATRAMNIFLQSMKDGAVTQGYIPDLSPNGNIRGRVYFGATRDELRDFARANDLLWSIQDGKLTLIPQTSYIAGDSPTISPDTGLIGIPEQTQNGIAIKVLLNPSIKIGQSIKLQSQVNLYRYALDIQSVSQNQTLADSIKTNGDGLYYVMVANHSGDTRGKSEEKPLQNRDLMCYCLILAAVVICWRNIAPGTFGT